jgi:hypothetical protein
VILIHWISKQIEAVLMRFELEIGKTCEFDDAADLGQPSQKTLESPLGQVKPKMRRKCVGISLWIF